MYTYDIRSVVGVYTPVGVATEWLWSVHSKLECTLRQGKGIDVITYSFLNRSLYLFSKGVQEHPFTHLRIVTVILPTHSSANDF